MSYADFNDLNSPRPRDEGSGAFWRRKKKEVTPSEAGEGMSCKSDLIRQTQVCKPEDDVPWVRPTEESEPSIEEIQQPSLEELIDLAPPSPLKQYIDATKAGKQLRTGELVHHSSHLWFHPRI